MQYSAAAVCSFGTVPLQQRKRRFQLHPPLRSTVTVLLAASWATEKTALLLSRGAAPSQQARPSPLLSVQLPTDAGQVYPAGTAIVFEPVLLLPTFAITHDGAARQRAAAWKAHAA